MFPHRHRQAAGQPGDAGGVGPCLAEGDLLDVRDEGEADVVVLRQALEGV
jgi:hypothetical protein